MKKLVVFLMVLGFFVGGSGLAQAAGESWYFDVTTGRTETPVLGYDSYYDGNVNVITTNGAVVLPYSDPTSPPNVGTSMSVFTVGQQVHTGSGVNLNVDTSYMLDMLFNDITNSGRNRHYTEIIDASSDPFWMTWNSPTGVWVNIPSGTDGDGISMLDTADIGNWNYVETYFTQDVDGLYTVNVLDSTTPFEVRGVPEPASMLLLGFGLVGIAGIRRKFSN